MPFRSVQMPALAFASLKALGNREGFAVDVAHLDLHFALRFSGLADYSFVVDESDAGIGEWIFSQAAFGDFEPTGSRHPDFFTFLETRHYEPDEIEIARRLRALVPAFLRHCEKAFDWHAYDLVGLTTTCAELTPALALARHLRPRYPHVRFMLGGAKCEGEMGAEIFRRFPDFDYVFSGEADISFPALLRDLRDERGEAVPGVRRRDIDPAPFVPAKRADLDSLPVPDYGDYFRCLDQLGGGVADIRLLLEGSRGCWWGEHSHCTFCGLNGTMMAFRQKQPERLVAEIEHLVESHQHFQFSFADNILDYDAHKTLLPRLADLDYPLKLFAEVKVNLKRPQLELMRRAGIDAIQPGIESLSTPVLKIMRKGVDALQNVQLLKWSEELAIVVHWNILMGFPGETDDHYAAMLDLLAGLTHLQPPKVATPLRMDRFSPFFEQARAADRRGAEGDGNGTPESPIRLGQPAQAYFHSLDLPAEAIERLAYHFDYELAVEAPDPALPRRVQDFVREWQRAYRPQSLTYLAGRDFLRLEDRRFNRPARTIKLGAREKAIYLACREARNARTIAGLLERGEVPGSPSPMTVSAEEIARFLDALVDERLVMREGSRYLALAVPFDATFKNFFELTRRTAPNAEPLMADPSAAEARPAEPRATEAQVAESRVAESRVAKSQAAGAP